MSDAPRLPTVLELLRQEAQFLRYQDGNLWYRIKWIEDRKQHSVPMDSTYQIAVHREFDFPIPVSDAGGGEFLPTDKAVTFMRWIRRHLEYLHGALAEGVYDQ